MNLQQIKTSLKDILVDRLAIDLAEVDSSDDAGLFDDKGWGIDSIDVLDLVLGVEKSFGVRIDQDEDIKIHFQSIETLAAYIQSQMAVEQPV
jgi:acyl carrier protein